MGEEINIWDEGALQMAYGELDKWQNQYNKLMKQKNGFLKTSHWQSISKISRTIEAAYNKTSSSNDNSVKGLTHSHSNSTAEFYGDNNYSSMKFTEDSFSGSSFSSEVHEDLCDTKLSRNMYETDTTTKQVYIEREKTKHGERLLAVNPYLNFLKRLEEPENHKVKEEQFQQEVSELSSQVFSIPTLSKEKKKVSYDDNKPIVTDEEPVLKLLNERKAHLNVNLSPFKRGQLNLPSQDHQTLHPQLIPSNQLTVHFFNAKPHSKYSIAWYIDCKEWFKPRLKDSFPE